MPTHPYGAIAPHDQLVVYEKYVARVRDRVRDFKNKLSAGLRRLLPKSIHVFEDLDKGRSC
jgi:hypothetical protein